MFVAHSFRLRDPWQREQQGENVRWTRVFHKPTGLEAGDQLWIVISGLPSVAAVSINGVAVNIPNPDQCGQFHVTALVRDSNQIAIDLAESSASTSPSSSDFPFDVRLAIVEP